jgi:hypothetical protein
MMKTQIGEMFFEPMEKLWLEPQLEMKCIVEPGILPTGSLMVIGGDPPTFKTLGGTGLNDETIVALVYFVTGADLLQPGRI